MNGGSPYHRPTPLVTHSDGRENDSVDWMKQKDERSIGMRLFVLVLTMFFGTTSATAEPFKVKGISMDMTVEEMIQVAEEGGSTCVKDEAIISCDGPLNFSIGLPNNFWGFYVMFDCKTTNTCEYDTLSIAQALATEYRPLVTNYYEDTVLVLGRRICLVGIAGDNLCALADSVQMLPGTVNAPKMTFQ